MKRIKIVGMCLVAVFALSALVASSASAAPEYKTCVKAANPATEGEFASKTCAGAAEKSSATTKYKLAAYNKGKDKLATKGKGSEPVNRQIYPALKEAVAYVKCTGEKSSGTITGPSTSTSTVEYKGCADSEGKNCNTAGEGKGKIKTHKLVTELVDQPGATEGVGIVISPESGDVLATYECEGGLKVTAIGAVEGEVFGGATKEAVKEVKLKFAHGTGPYQQWGYIGQSEVANGEKFNEFFESEGAKGTPPNAYIVSHIEGNTNPELPPEFTLPATQEGETAIKGEEFKIVG